MWTARWAIRQSATSDHRIDRRAAGQSSAGFHAVLLRPQEENLALQQAALQQTGKASFIDGLTYDSKTHASVTEQEKQDLYQNALDYAKANNVRLGDAQAQVSALDKPMLWYVEQTVPAPSCMSSGSALAACGTITALMPQVYLPVADTEGMSAGGNISGKDVTLDFGKGAGGSVLNTGSITAGALDVVPVRWRAVRLCGGWRSDPGSRGAVIYTHRNFLPAAPVAIAALVSDGVAGAPIQPSIVGSEHSVEP